MVMVHDSHNTTKRINRFQPFHTYLRAVPTGFIGYDLKGRNVYRAGIGKPGMCVERNNTAPTVILIRTVAE